MSNKALGILWVLIIAGLAFIYINLSTTETIIEDPIKIDVSEETKVIDNNPETYNGYLSLGNRLIEQGDYQKAVENFQKAVSINNTSIKPLIKLSQAYLKNNQAKEAQETLEKAKKINKEDPAINLLLTQAYIDQRNFSAAKSTADLLDQDIDDTKYYQAILAILNQDFDSAKKLFNDTQRPEAEFFRKAFEKFSYFKEGETLHLQVLLAKALTEAQQYQASIPLLFDVINTKNNYLDAWIVLGYAYLNTNKPLDAVDAFTNAKDLDPEKPETLFFLGLAHFANNDIEKAIFFLEKADTSGYEPKEQIDLKLADLYLLQEEYEKSEKKFTEVLSKNTNTIEVFTKVIWLNIDKLKNPDKALSVAQAALEIHKENAMSYNLVGWALTANAKYSEAKTYLDKALSMQPNLEAAHLNLGWLYELKGQEEKAKDSYKKAYSLGTGNSVAELAAQRFNNIAEKETENYYKNVNISSP